MTSRLMLAFSESSEASFIELYISGAIFMGSEVDTEQLGDSKNENMFMSVCQLS